MSENNTTKYEETKLTIDLRTGVSHTNSTEQAQTRIDYASYYLGSIFWFIRVAIETESLLELQTKSKAYTDSQFREHVQVLAQIGEAFCEQLPEYQSALTQSLNQTEPEPTAAAEIITPDMQLQSLAAELSSVLKNPRIPTRIYNALVDELAETFIDTDAPENILRNLKSLLEKEID